MESKTVRVHPEEESQAIDHYELYGWHLVNRQEIFSQKEAFDGASSITYQGFTQGTVYTHTETTHFVSLLFQRDGEEAINSALAELETQYDQKEKDLNRVYDQYLTKKRPERIQAQNGSTYAFILGFAFLAGGAILTALGATALDSPGEEGRIPLFFAGIALILVSLFVLVLGGHYDKKAKEIPNDLSKEGEDQADQIFAEMDKLDDQAEAVKKNAQKKEATPALTAGEETAEQVKKAKELLDAGILSKEEFEAIKHKYLKGLE
jgi:hypothetical protein